MKSLILIILFLNSFCLAGSKLTLKEIQLQDNGKKVKSKSKYLIYSYNDLDKYSQNDKKLIKIQKEYEATMSTAATIGIFGITFVALVLTKVLPYKIYDPKVIALELGLVGTAYYYRNRLENHLEEFVNEYNKKTPSLTLGHSWSF